MGTLLKHFPNSCGTLLLAFLESNFNKVYMYIKLSTEICAESYIAESNSYTKICYGYIRGYF